MNSKFTSTTAFLDLLFNMLLVFVAMFLMAILLINPPQTEANVDQNVEYVITIRWDNNTKHDVDLWMTDGKETVGFINKQGSNFFLTRDDIGPDSMDRILGFSVNEETMSILGGIPGKYTAAVHLYAVREEPPPVKVTWVLTRVRGGPRRIAHGEVTLTAKGQEITIVHFEINDEGKIVNIDTTTNRPFVRRAATVGGG